MRAIKHGHLKIVQFLDKRGAKSFFKKGFGLRHAISNNDLPMVKFLLEKSLSKDKNLILLQRSYYELAKSKKDSDEYKEIVKYIIKKL